MQCKISNLLVCTSRVKSRDSENVVKERNGTFFERTLIFLRILQWYCRMQKELQDIFYLKMWRSTWITMYIHVQVVHTAQVVLAKLWREDMKFLNISARINFLIISLHIRNVHSILLNIKYYRIYTTIEISSEILPYD